MPAGRTVGSPAAPHGRQWWPLLAALGLALLWCLGLLLVRWRLTSHLGYTFLVWNLFLAAVPLGFAFWLAHVRQRMVGVGLLAGWLLFFPNAPYVFTDFIHLSPYGRAPLWFDVLLLTSFALAALWLGLVSLHLIHEWVEWRFSPLAGWGVVLLSCPLAGFGVYLGRVWALEQLGCPAPPRGPAGRCGGAVDHARGRRAGWGGNAWLRRVAGGGLSHLVGAQPRAAVGCIFCPSIAVAWSVPVWHPGRATGSLGPESIGWCVPS